MKLPSLPSWAFTAGGVALALVAGIMIGRNSRADEHSSKQTDSAMERPGRDRPTIGDRSRGSANSEGRRANSDRSNGSGSALGLDAILDSTSRLTRIQRLLSYLDRLPGDQFAEVYTSISESPSARLQGSERSLILQAWAERDPYGALAHLQENGAEDWERETAVSAWAAMDPEAAFSWAIDSEDAGKVNNWVVGALRGIAAASPELARDYLVQMEAGDTRSYGLNQLERYVTQNGFDYASNWIAGVTDDGLRQQASRRFASEMTKLDPASAGEWNAAIADTKTRRDVSETVSDRWARTDLEGAKAWVTNLPEDTRTEAAEGVARHYARQDPVAAADWLSGLGDNPDLDGAKRIFIDEAFRSDPQTSLDFVSNLSDDRTRTGYYHRYLGSWMKRDADAAKQWASANAEVLPESVARRVLR